MRRLMSLDCRRLASTLEWHWGPEGTIGMLVVWTRTKEVSRAGRTLRLDSAALRC